MSDAAEPGPIGSGLDAEMVAAIFGGGIDPILNDPEPTHEQLLVVAALCHGDLDSIRRLDAHPFSDATTLDRALADVTEAQWSDRFFRYQVAGLLCLPGHRQLELARDPDQDVAVALARNIMVTRDALDILFKRGRRVRMAIASNDDLPVWAAARSAQSRTWQVREAVARSTRHPTVLKRLLLDRRDDVVEAAATNRRTTSLLIREALDKTRPGYSDHALLKRQLAGKLYNEDPVNNPRPKTRR